MRACVVVDALGFENASGDVLGLCAPQATYSLAAEAYTMTNVGSNPAPQSLTGERAVP